jgi:hypothetical protein
MFSSKSIFHIQRRVQAQNLPTGHQAGVTAHVCEPTLGKQSLQLLNKYAETMPAF